MFWIYTAICNVFITSGMYFVMLNIFNTAYKKCSEGPIKENLNKIVFVLIQNFRKHICSNTIEKKF